MSEIEQSEQIAQVPAAIDPTKNANESDLIRLHIGGQAVKDGWKILNVQPGPHVDYVGCCTDLSAFETAAVTDVYASHVLEHLDYMHELGPTLEQIHRVLKPGGRLLISVPDLNMLCTLFVHPDVTPSERHGLMRMMFGGQIDPFDYHKVGFNWDILSGYLNAAGFNSASQVETFGLFDDSSECMFRGNYISLNVIAVR